MVKDLEADTGSSGSVIAAMRQAIGVGGVRTTVSVATIITTIIVVIVVGRGTTVSSAPAGTWA